MSIRRYFPPIGTAGFDREWVSGNRRVPRPPPRMIASTSRIARQDMRGPREPAIAGWSARICSFVAAWCSRRYMRPLGWFPDARDGPCGGPMALTISTIVCAYNEADYIGPCLQSLRRQTRPPDEIVVVNNASTDETAAIAADVTGVRVIDEPEKGLVRAREAGRLAAAGDLL